jgi:hypothetical protein
MLAAAILAAWLLGLQGTGGGASVAGSLRTEEGAGRGRGRGAAAATVAASRCPPVRLCLRGGSARMGRPRGTTKPRDESALPEFEPTTWRINASCARGAWPGPATTYIVPTEEEFAEFGNGRMFPGRDGENVTLEEFVRCAVATTRPLPSQQLNPSLS